jgi:hypothetical protein
MSISRSTYWFADSGTSGRVDGPRSVSASSSTPSSNVSRLAEDEEDRSGLGDGCVGDLYPEEAGRRSLPRECPADVLCSDETDDQLGLEVKGGIGNFSLLLD